MTISWVRGTCPRCGSAEVLHRVLGMPIREAFESSPDWVRWEGCTAFGPERECEACEHRWSPDDVGFAEEGEERWDIAADEAEVGWLIGRGLGSAGERELHLDCYWARPTGPAPRTSTDHDRLEWLEPAQLAGRDWAAPDLPIVQQLLAGARPRFGR